MDGFTQIKNVLIDEEMPNLSGAAFKILILIARQTVGWVEDSEKGTRKQKDWMSHSQLVSRTGHAKATITKAIKELVDRKLILVSDTGGNILQESSDRRGKSKLFYEINFADLSRKWNAF